MPRPPFWAFSIAGFFCLDCLFGISAWRAFFFFGCLSSLDWMNFLGIFCLPCFSQLKLFWCTLYTSFLPRCARTFLCLMNLFFFWWLFNFTDTFFFFFFFLHWWNFISLSLIEWKLIFLWWSLIFSLMNSLLVFHVF